MGWRSSFGTGKGGGVAVLGAMAAISRLKVKRNVVGLIASAENMPGGNAYRPGDIVTTYDGKHIEIINTDAEGRVVLADAIAYARRDSRASAIVDLATLTGASTAAAFLKAFAEDTPWAHLDIAPVAHANKDRADLARGATGFGVRTLVELIERWR